MKQITTTNMTVKLTDLTINPFLAKYGRTKITDFEVGQYLKFNLPTGHVICTKNNDVLYNYEAVETAMKMGLKTIDVCVLDIDTEATMQVICFKNMRRRLSRRQLAELIVELRNYMNETEAGKHWKKEIPGDEINKKIGFLIDYSYGMINQLERLYKYNPDLLNSIDGGDMTFKQALEFLPKVSKPETFQNKQTPASKPLVDDTLVDADPHKQVSHEDSIEEVDGSKDVTGIECESCHPDATMAEGIKPVKVDTDGWDFAGEKHTKPCEGIEELVIRFTSGKEIKLHVQDNNVSAEIFGKSTGNIQYGGGIQHNVDGSQFHVFKAAENSQIQVIIYNSDNLAA